MSNSITITITINGVSSTYEITEQNAKLTRTFTGYNVTATVMHVNNGAPELVNRTCFIEGTTIDSKAIDKAFAPDKVGAILKTEKVNELHGTSLEAYKAISLVLPDRPEYPSVKARKEAREAKK